MGRYLLIIILFTLAAYLTGYHAGYNEHKRDSRPVHIDTNEKTVRGLLYQCPPEYFSYIVPATYTRLDTVEGRGAAPFHGIVFVIEGSDTLGFYRIK